MIELLQRGVEKVKEPIVILVVFTALLCAFCVVNSPQSASATSSPPTLLKAPTTGGVAGIKSRSLPRGSLMESVHAGAERVPNVAYVKDHFSGKSCNRRTSWCLYSKLPYADHALKGELSPNFTF